MPLLSFQFALQTWILIAWMCLAVGRPMPGLFTESSASSRMSRSRSPHLAVSRLLEPFGSPQIASNWGDRPRFFKRLVVVPLNRPSWKLFCINSWNLTTHPPTYLTDVFVDATLRWWRKTGFIRFLFDLFLSKVEWINKGKLSTMMATPRFSQTPSIFWVALLNSANVWFITCAVILDHGNQVMVRMVSRFPSLFSMSDTKSIHGLPEVSWGEEKIILSHVSKWILPVDFLDCIVLCFGGSFTLLRSGRKHQM